MNQPTRPNLVRAITLTVLAVLLGVVTLETADKIDASLVKLGGALWQDYALELRRDPDAPLCDIEKLNARRTGCTDSAPPPSASDDPFADPFGDPFADPGAAPDDDPFADPLA